MNPMNKKLAGAAIVAAALLQGTAVQAASGTVAFLMPDQASTRYEEHDFPGFKAEMEKLCPDCTVIYQNADADVARQQQQFNSVLTQGAKVIVLDPVDSSAAASLVALAQSQGVKVIAYDRPIPDKTADYYVSFDNEGHRQGNRRVPGSATWKNRASRRKPAACCRSTAHPPMPLPA